MTKIMVDSSCDCQEEKLHDYFQPIAVTLDGKNYFDGVDLSRSEFYELLTTSEDFPKTAQPSPQSFLDVFEQVKERGEELVYLSLSSALSGTYQTACIAKEMVDYDGIYIVDSHLATHCLHMMVLYAHQLVTSGCTGAEIAEKCSSFRDRIHVFAGLDTLEYLRRGGRIGPAAALIGDIANIKPILTITDDGRVDSIAKAIGLGRAISTIVTKAASYEIDPHFPIWSMITVGLENSEKLEDALAKKGIAVTQRQQVGPTVGAHLGPGLYGVIFVSKE